MKSKYLKYHKLIGLARIPSDDLVPDGLPHMVYIGDNYNNRFIPIFLTGSNWDFLWWIYRISMNNKEYISMINNDIDVGGIDDDSVSPDYGFDHFLHDYLWEIYRRTNNL